MGEFTSAETRLIRDLVGHYKNDSDILKTSLAACVDKLGTRRH